MKISTLSTDKATDILIELTPFICGIASDEELIFEIKRKVKPTGNETRADMLTIGANKITNLVPIVLQKHKEDVFGILSVIGEKTIDEIREQNILVTISQVVEITKDKDLMDFFKSCVATEGSE